MSTTADTNLIGEDQAAIVEIPVVDPDTTTDQHEHSPGEDEHGNTIECTDAGCPQRQP